MRVTAAACSCVLACAGAALAADVAVAPKKLVVVDKLAASGRAKVVYVAKDQAAITKGAGTDVGQIAVELDVVYGNGSAAGAFMLPAGASDGTAGWLANDAAIAKYVNAGAPAGPTQAAVAAIKPGRLLKLVGRGPGDVALDVIGGGDPGADGVQTAYCVTNGAEAYCHCSDFRSCRYESIGGGAGAKLVCRQGTGDPTCRATTPPTTTSTMTTTTTTTTLPTMACCTLTSLGYCGGRVDVGQLGAIESCLLVGGTVGPADSVCDASGECVTPPGVPGGCCESIPGVECLAGSGFTESTCLARGGTWFPSAVCHEDGTCG